MTPQPDIGENDFDTFLRVMDAVAVLPQEHPQHIAARRATSALFKAAKKHRRLEKRRGIAEAASYLPSPVRGDIAAVRNSFRRSSNLGSLVYVSRRIEILPTCPRPISL